MVVRAAGLHAYWMLCFSAVVVYGIGITLVLAILDRLQSQLGLAAWQLFVGFFHSGDSWSGRG
eukprot:6691670-Alexandrium_andersonii.AAC.1